MPPDRVHFHGRAEAWYMRDTVAGISIRPCVPSRYGPAVGERPLPAAQSGRSYAIAPREFIDPEALDKGHAVFWRLRLLRPARGTQNSFG